jgi:hypothetical protein
MSPKVMEIKSDSMHYQKIIFPNKFTSINNFLAVSKGINNTSSFLNVKTHLNVIIYYLLEVFQIDLGDQS